MENKILTMMFLLFAVTLLSVSGVSAALTEVYSNTTKFSGSDWGTTVIAFNHSPYSYREEVLTYEMPSDITSNAPKYWEESTSGGSLGNEATIFELVSGQYCLKNAPGYNTSVCNIPAGTIAVTYKFNETSDTYQFCYSGTCSNPRTSTDSAGKDFSAIEWGGNGHSVNVTSVSIKVPSEEVSGGSEPTHDPLPGHVANVVSCYAYGESVIIVDCAKASDGNTSNYASIPHNTYSSVDNVIYMNWTGVGDNPTFSYTYDDPRPTNSAVFNVYAYNWTSGQYWPIDEYATVRFPPQNSTVTVDIKADFISNGKFLVRADIYAGPFNQSLDGHFKLREAVVNYDEPTGGTCEEIEQELAVCEQDRDDAYALLQAVVNLIQDFLDSHQ